MSDPIQSLDENVQGFEPGEVVEVCTNYVCAVCHSTLVSMEIPGEWRRVIVCLEHGNVEICGRVLKSTVSIENERAYLQYKFVVRNLSDLWGSLIEKGFQIRRSTALKIIHECVCKKCGSGLNCGKSSDDDFYEINCWRCGSVDINGYVKREEYYAHLRTNRSK